jgi:hypothetical protein
MTSKYFPPQNAIKTGRNRKVEITVTKEKRGRVPDDVTAERLAAAGIISSDPNAKRAKSAGSSPALRIACPVCDAPAGSYCTKLVDYKPVQQTIAHKRRREEEERTR